MAGNTTHESEDQEDIPQPDYVLSLRSSWFEAVIFLMTASVGLWFVVGSFGMPGSKSALGPGSFPFLAGSLLILVSLAQVYVSIRSPASDTAVVFVRPLAVVLAAVMILLFPPAIDRLGYFPVAAIWTPVFAILSGLRSPLSVVLVKASVLLLAWLGFGVLLGTPLP